MDEMMVEAYVSGVSQRKMGDVTEALLGERVGRSTVSRVAKRLDGAVEALRSAPIEGPHPYLYLDATFLDARWARKVENVSALVAYAVDPDGHRRLLAITLGPEESEDRWSELLEQLLERGLSGVELVIADEHAGLAAALRRFLPEVRRQRCTVHLQRNVLAKVPHRLRKRVAREVAAVFRAPGLAKAKKRLAEITARWHNELPEAMRVLERGFTAATQFYAFPEPHWARLRTTNSLERLHTEIKRRIRSAGAFPDRASALRLITAVALRTTAVWSERRYLDLSLLEPKEGRQGSLTEEASRSFPSLLHTTRDLTDLGWGDRLADVCANDRGAVNRKIAGMTPLHQAVLRRDTNMDSDLSLLKALLRAGADTTITDDEHNATALMWAQVFGDAEAEELLSGA